MLKTLLTNVLAMQIIFGIFYSVHMAMNNRNTAEPIAIEQIAAYGENKSNPKNS